MFNVMRHLFIRSPPGALPTTADAMQALPAPVARYSRAFRRTVGYTLGAVGVAGKFDVVGFGFKAERLRRGHRLADVVEPSVSDGLPLIPFFRLHGQRYQMYWQLTTKEELAARRDRMAANDARAAAESAVRVRDVAQSPFRMCKPMMRAWATPA